ncbi:hypothetical protein PRVXH_001307 [Proteinivorax hydrogeniformans]|uniref:Uncharacterized protein n=1 Tax=Proteinivorax hydrogeniformans TaxID=1826727 RepID=A0AAU8HX73_9FIRM
MSKIPGYNDKSKKYNLYDSKTYHPEIFDLINHYWHNEETENDKPQQNDPDTF